MSGPPGEKGKAPDDRTEASHEEGLSAARQIAASAFSMAPGSDKIGHPRPWRYAERPWLLPPLQPVEPTERREDWQPPCRATDAHVCHSKLLHELEALARAGRCCVDSDEVA